MDKADQHPAGHQACLSLNHCLKKCKGQLISLCEVGIVPGSRVVEQRRQQVTIAECCRILKGTDADMTGGYSSEHSARQGSASEHCFASRGHR